MPCFGDREKGEVRVEEKWDYINLSDFKSRSCWTPFSYFFLLFFLVISFAVYAVDTFTAVNLLAFSRWSGEIEPAIPFKISRWIFTVCILLSFALLIVRWVFAIRAMRSGSIAESYLNSLAVRVESIRVGKARGWKRFLVFAELTKSRKGVEYVALFVYFSFESWLRTIFADGPRQVVNAITLYSVMKLNLLPEGEHASHDGKSSFEQFFDNIKAMGEHNQRQAVVMFAMLFTLIVWVISILQLAVAVILYLLFLFHYIPTGDGSLKGYCRRKINTRLKEIVRRKVTKALNKGVPLIDRKPTQPTFGPGDRKPTLPTFPSVDSFDGDKLPRVNLSRTTTETTLPPYSRPGTTPPDQNPSLHRQPTIPDLTLSEDQLPLNRTVTEASAYSESALLTEQAATMGYSPIDHRQSYAAPPVPPLPKEGLTRFQSPVPGASTSQSRYTPGYRPPADGFGRRSPATENHGPADNYDPYTTGPNSNRPYGALGPAAEPNARSLTPRGAWLPPNDTYPGRTLTPTSRAPSTRPQADIDMGDYRINPTRSVSPGFQGCPSRADAYLPFNPSSEYRAQSPNIRPGTVAPPNGYDNSSQGYAAWNGTPYPTRYGPRGAF